MSSQEETIKNTVIARIDAIPQGVGISFGNGYENLTKEDLIKHVQAGDEIGQEIIKIQMDFLTSLKDNFLYG